jgi:hypothetical protein
MDELEKNGFIKSVWIIMLNVILRCAATKNLFVFFRFRNESRSFAGAQDDMPPKALHA